MKLIEYILFNFSY